MILPEDQLEAIITQGGPVLAALIFLCALAFALWKLIVRPAMTMGLRISEEQTKTAEVMKGAASAANAAAAKSERAATQSESVANVNLKMAELLERRLEVLNQITTHDHGGQ